DSRPIELRPKCKCIGAEPLKSARIIQKPDCGGGKSVGLEGNDLARLSSLNLICQMRYRGRQHRQTRGEVEFYLRRIGEPGPAIHLRAVHGNSCRAPAEKIVQLLVRFEISEEANMLGDAQAARTGFKFRLKWAHSGDVEPKVWEFVHYERYCVQHQLETLVRQ